MTWPERARAAARFWLALPALLVVVALVLAWRLNAGRNAAEMASRLAEEARARAAGQLVVEQARAHALENEARRLAGQNEDLAAELARARAALPGARVTGTASSSTGARPAGGAPRPGPACPAAEPPAAATPPPATPPPAPACLLAVGDEGEIRVDQVVLDNRHGAQLLVGAASAWRVTPEPRTKVLSGPFRAELSRAQVETPEAVPGWGAGLYAGFSRDGWAVGPAVALPPARLWGLQGEVVIGVGVGPSGAWQGSGAALLRF